MFSQYASERELLKSATADRLGLSNIPTKEHRDSLHITCRLFDIIRVHFGVPIGITSGYRSTELNKAIHGAHTTVNGKYVATSQHCKGEALDIDADVYGRISNSEIFEYIKNNLNFDQLIWEYGDDNNPAWVHFSTKPSPSHNRKQVLRCWRDHNGKTIYAPWEY